MNVPRWHERLGCLSRRRASQVDLNASKSNLTSSMVNFCCIAPRIIARFFSCTIHDSSCPRRPFRSQSETRFSCVCKHLRIKMKSVMPCGCIESLQYLPYHAPQQTKMRVCAVHTHTWHTCNPKMRSSTVRFVTNLTTRTSLF
jgi:hypothetical protein